VKLTVVKAEDCVATVRVVTILAPLEVLMILAESEAKNLEPLLKIETEVTLEPASAERGEAADGLLVVIVSERREIVDA